MSELFIGLMSGTSLDGLDGVLVDLSEAGTGRIKVLGHEHQAFEPPLIAELLALNAPGGNELHRSALAANELSRIAAALIDRLLQSTGILAGQVRAVGSHGQTVRHRPGEFDATGYTSQLNNPALLAELTGIDVVADFRSRDVAAGGQGAPLVPAFHRAIFADDGATVAVLNLGGMSNLTVLRGSGETVGFDCGPGNVLLDLWCQRQLGKAYDADGQWAARGSVDARLLEVMQHEPFFTANPPKSTGRDRFNALWLDAALTLRGNQPAALDARDVQATLAELTAWVCARDMSLHAADARKLLVCGGGALNRDLMQRLSSRLPDVTVAASGTAGLPANQVEAVAFAWLARRCVHRQPGNLHGVTGAAGPRILGAVYPGC